MEVNMIEFSEQIQNIKIDDEESFEEDYEEYIPKYIENQQLIHSMVPIHIMQIIFYIAFIDNSNPESTIRTWDELNRDRLDYQLVCKDWNSILKSSCRNLTLSINNLKSISNEILTFSNLKKLEIVSLHNDDDSDTDTEETETESDEESNDDSDIEFKNYERVVYNKKSNNQSSNKIKEIIDSEDEEHELNKPIKNSDIIIKNLITILESNHKTLRVLDLSMLSLKDYHIEKLLPLLENHKYIEEIILDSNPLRDQGIIFISNIINSNKNIKILDLQSTKSKDGLQYIGESIKNNKTLENLIWSYNKSSYSSIISLSNGLRVNKTLVSLVLKGCKIEGWGAYSLSETLGINRTLTSLDLSLNEFGDRGGCSIAEKLNLHPSLTDLDLSCNSISSDAFNSIFQSLESNKILTSLNLSKNMVDPLIPLDTIFFSLSHNKSLTVLNLSECSLQNTHFDLISQGLCHNKTLLKLDLSRNNFSKITPFITLIQNNKTLNSINLSKHKFKLGDLNLLLHYLLKKKPTNIYPAIEIESIVHKIKFVNLTLSPEPISKEIYNLLKEYRSNIDFTKIKI